MQQEKFQPDSTPLYITYKAELILLLVTFTWGLSFPMIKLSLTGISPMAFILIRFTITLALYLIFFGKKIKISDYSAWKYGLLLGVFLFCGFGFQTMGLKYTSASKSAFITGTSLIIIPFAQFLILNSRPKAENIAGALIVLAGLVILSESYILTPNFGDVLTLICAFSFAVHIVLLDKYSRSVNFSYLVFGQFLAMVVLSLLSVIIFELFVFGDFFIVFNSDLIFPLLFTSLFSTFISIILMTKYQNKTSPLRAGIIYNMESLFAVFFSYLLINERLNFPQITGALLMITGLFISEFYSLFKIKYSGGKEI
ncbi:MAG: DMT family transporter [Ignavibacteria bacterium]|nr:DMT family transporter [Ignavibacteria bacterium]